MRTRGAVAVLAVGLLLARVPLPPAAAVTAPRPPRRRRPRRVAAGVGLAVWALVLVASLLGGCADPGKSAAGIVIALDAEGGAVSGFTLRTRRGETIAFVIGDLEADGAAFPAAHLAEHAATLQPIAVAYRVEDGVNVVHRMVDAPWAAASP